MVSKGCEGLGTLLGFWGEGVPHAKLFTVSTRGVCAEAELTLSDWYLFINEVFAQIEISFSDIRAFRFIEWMYESPL